MISRRYEEAIELFQWALNADYQHFGEDHSRVATDRNNLAVVYDNLGRYEEAIELYSTCFRFEVLKDLWGRPSQCGP